MIFKQIIAAFYNCHNEKNECMKKGMMCKFMDETVPKFCEQMTCLLKKNGGKYFVGDCVSKIWHIQWSQQRIPCYE